MNTRQILILTAVYSAVVVITLGIIRLAGIDDPNFALVAGAIIGSMVGGLLIYRCKHSELTLGDKTRLGGLLAALCIVVGIVLQLAAGIFRYPETSIAIGVVGSFCAPSFLANSIPKQLLKAESNPAGRND